jgi:hypothetical protein
MPRPKHLKPNHHFNPADFPKLKKKNHDVTSDDDPAYNCIAWAAGEDGRQWWPILFDAYWPAGVPLALTVDAFMAAFATEGYVQCNDGGFEEGLEKIALYVKNGIPQHAARQVDASKWTSKLGVKGWDIEHQRDAVSSGMYGEIACYLSRPKPTPQN